jgi:taurine dioxygenase
MTAGLAPVPGKNAVNVTPLTTTIGARVDNIDVGVPLDAATAQAVRDALAIYSVLHIPNQQIGLDQQKQFAAIFGPLEQVLSHRMAGNFDTTAVIDNSSYKPAFEQRLPVHFELREEFQNWHVDNSYCPEISAVSILRPEVLSPVGGMTAWASMAAAYEALSPTFREWLEPLEAVHVMSDGQRQSFGVHRLPPEEQKRWDQIAAYKHPVVVQHPATGRKSLYVNPNGVIKIDKLSNSESVTLLRYLYQHCTRPDFTYRHLWNDGDIVVWDQLATMHLEPRDYYPHERRVVRVSAGLIRPASANAFRAEAIESQED